MRLPDFIIIGTMKSGTTSLHAWLTQQPDFFLPQVKEPNFFSHDEVWARGLPWYTGLFSSAMPDSIVGEASVGYTSPRFGEVAASRLMSVLPAVRLIYLLRHPIERMRSHYRHEVQRGREQRPFADAVGDPHSPYVASSRYFSCLEPYIQAFPRDHICVVRFEDLVIPPNTGWFDVLVHVGAPKRPAPRTLLNVSSEKGRYTRAMLWAWESDWTRFSAWVPRSMRRAAKRVLIRRDARYLQKVEDSHGPIPLEAAKQIWKDISLLEKWLGADTPLWQSSQGISVSHGTVPPNNTSRA